MRLIGLPLCERPYNSANGKSSRAQKPLGGACYGPGSMSPEMSVAAAEAPPAGADARERILAAAYELFSRNGIRAVGIDAIIARSGVARMTLYRHFASKDELVLAFLQRREQLWTRDWLEASVESRASDPAERLLAIFDVFDKWFHSPDYEGCSFVNVLLEMPDRSSPLNRASAEHLATIRAFLERLAREAGVRDPEGVARQWHILMKGSIVAAGEGDREAARRAKELGTLLLRETGVRL
jgi:AcrR family transcriptional regulator